MNRNLIIGALVALLVLGSIWGQINNKSRIYLKEELKKVEAQLEEERNRSSEEQSQVLSKTAELQKEVQELQTQLSRAREELVALRKANKGLEAQLSERDAVNQKLAREKNDLAARLASLQEAVAAQETTNRQLQDVQKQVADCNGALQQARKQVASLQKELGTKDASLKDLQQQLAQVSSKEQVTEQVREEVTEVTRNLQQRLQEARQTIEELRDQLVAAEHDNKVAMTRLERELEAARAQILGMEKIIDEKNAALEESNQELDRLKINMDVLLAKVAEQRDALQELQQENQDLAKDLAIKNEEIASLHDKLMQSPVQE